MSRTTATLFAPLACIGSPSANHAKPTSSPCATAPTTTHRGRPRPRYPRSTLRTWHRLRHPLRRLRDRLRLRLGDHRGRSSPTQTSRGSHHLGPQRRAGHVPIREFRRTRTRYRAKRHTGSRDEQRNYGHVTGTPATDSSQSPSIGLLEVAESLARGYSVTATATAAELRRSVSTDHSCVTAPLGGHCGRRLPRSLQSPSQRGLQPNRRSGSCLR